MADRNESARLIFTLHGTNPLRRAQQMSAGQCESAEAGWTGAIPRTGRAASLLRMPRVHVRLELREITRCSRFAQDDSGTAIPQRGDGVGHAGTARALLAGRLRQNFDRPGDCRSGDRHCRVRREPGGCRFVPGWHGWRGWGRWRSCRYGQRGCGRCGNSRQQQSGRLGREQWTCRRWRRACGAQLRNAALRPTCGLRPGRRDSHMRLRARIRGRRHHL